MQKICVLLIAAAVLALTACDGIFGGGDQIQAQEVFSLVLFEQNVRDAFAGSVGFTYAIAQDGSLKRADGVGVGLTEFEPEGERQMHEDQRMHIASISKTITTAAVLRLLEDTPGVGLDSSIEPYLPPLWTRGPGVGAISFRQLLAHKSGFFFGLVAAGETDDLLAEHIEDGNILQQDDPIYDNVHHALFRVVVPYLLGEQHTDSSETEAQFHARVFAEYVQEVVFTPAGVPASRATTVPPANSNRYYPWPYDNLPGVDGTDFTLNHGAYGWYLSVVDLAAVLAHLRFTEDIVSDESRTIMNAENLGWWNTRTGDHGTYNMKQGGWRWTSRPVEKGMQSIAANLAAGVQAVVIVNSRRDPSATDPTLQPFDMATMMRDAFDNAFVSP
ncbi:MAG: serine hydrolase domain-containing protein [Spirochaetota bacterium]